MRNRDGGSGTSDWDICRYVVFLLFVLDVSDPSECSFALFRVQACSLDSGRVISSLVL